MNKKKKYSYFIKTYKIEDWDKSNIHRYIEAGEDCKETYASIEECLEKAKEEIIQKELKYTTDYEYFVYIVELQKGYIMVDEGI